MVNITYSLSQGLQTADSQTNVTSQIVRRRRRKRTNRKKESRKEKKRQKKKKVRGGLYAG